MAFKASLAKYRASHPRKVAAARGMMGRLKPLGIGGASGAGAQYAGEFAADHLEFVRTKWWGEAAVLGGAAYVAQTRTRQEVAYGLAGAAGYSAAQRRKISQGKNPLAKFTPGAASSSPAAGTTSGVDDDTGALQSGGGDF